MDKKILFYDEDLFDSLRNMGAYIDESGWLRDHIRIESEERERFLNNEIENPEFIYRKQTVSTTYGEKLEDFYRELDKSKAPAVVIDLYREKLEEQLLRNALVAASLSADDESFMKNNVALYGKPSMKYFSYVAGRVLSLCKEQEAKHLSSATRLRKLLSKINFQGSVIDVGILPPKVEGSQLITSVDQVVDIFKTTLDLCGIEGWKIVVDKGERSKFLVKKTRKSVYIPSKEKLFARPKPLTKAHVKALAEHEIGVHVRRSFEAHKSPLKLLQMGLDNYIKGEEGLAGYSQQQIEGADEFYGFDRYLAASLACGMDGEERDFRAVFSLMTDYYTLKFSATGVSKNVPFQAAWDVCVRIFRGTTGQSSGYIFTKDIIYLEGNIEMWNLLSERPQVFESLFLGKFNPLLPRHVNTLQTLGILKEW